MKNTKDESETRDKNKKIGPRRALAMHYTFSMRRK